MCPHNCRANRLEGKLGFCRTDGHYNIASICAHFGEEPVISGDNGICNVFFSHCNMQCSYCQNYQISNKFSKLISSLRDEDVIKKICDLLDSGCHAVGFVSPSHCIIQMVDIIKKINNKGYKPTIVYNTNAYDKVETLKMIEDYVDIYLPDFKYANDNLAYTLSGVKNYVETALNAIGEMIHQKGTLLELNEAEIATKGVIIRHLVLPHCTSNSKKVLQLIAENFGNKLPISLMSQYYPNPQVKNISEINSFVEPKAYNEVVAYLDYLRFENGWVQEIDSNHTYRPDFDRKHPFES